MNTRTAFICNNIGVSGTTPCHILKLDDGTFEARIGIAIMGSTNMDEEGFKKCNYDPFNDEFYDNYSSGIGATQDEAIENMKKDMSDTADMMWA